MIFKQKPEKPFLGLETLAEFFCAKCYVFVFKSKLLRPSHITFHIHLRGYKPSKEKPCFQQKKPSLNQLSTVIASRGFFGQSPRVFP
jgi:hypothetical protein